MHAGKQCIITSHNGNISRDLDLRLIESVKNSKCDHIIQPYNRGNILRFFQKFTRQLITDLVFRINMSHIKVELLPRRFDNYLILDSGFRKFFQKAFHSLGSLLLSCRKRWGNICHFAVSQFQKMLCHHSSKLRIIKFYRIYVQFFILIVNDRNRDLPGKLFHQPHKAMAGITGINDPQRL